MVFCVRGREGGKRREETREERKGGEADGKGQEGEGKGEGTEKRVRTSRNGCEEALETDPSTPLLSSGFLALCLLIYLPPRL